MHPNPTTKRVVRIRVDIHGRTERALLHLLALEFYCLTPFCCLLASHLLSLRLTLPTTHRRPLSLFQIPALNHAIESLHGKKRQCSSRRKTLTFAPTLSVPPMSSINQSFFDISPWELIRGYTYRRDDASPSYQTSQLSQTSDSGPSDGFS